MWTEQYQLLGSEDGINSVLIFENRGAMMGASNPHPHGQIWANATLPNEPAKEQTSFAAYQRQHTACLLCEYLKIEKEKKDRIVCENDEFAAMVPFWAVWPFETIVISKRHAGSLEQFSESGRDALADILHRVTARYDNLFATSFPYSMGFHQRPTDGEAASRVAFSRAFLSAAAAFGGGAEIHGGLRTAGDSAAGHHSGRSGGAFARCGREPVAARFQRAVRFLRRGAARFSAAADLCAQRIRSRNASAVNARHANQNPFVVDVVIGDVVRGRIGGQQLLALIKIRAYHQRFAVLMEAQEQHAAHAESGRAVGHALFDVVERQREFANGGEGDGHIRRLYLFHL